MSLIARTSIQSCTPQPHPSTPSSTTERELDCSSTAALHTTILRTFTRMQSSREGEGRVLNPVKPVFHFIEDLIHTLCTARVLDLVRCVPSI